MLGSKLAGADDRAAEISAVVKAALLDMDYAISVYLEASEAARIKAENEAKAVETAKADEREKAVSYVTAAMVALSNNDLTYRMSDDMPEEYRAIAVHFNEAMEKLASWSRPSSRPRRPSPPRRMRSTAAPVTCPRAPSSRPRPLRKRPPPPNSSPPR